MKAGVSAQTPLACATDEARSPAQMRPARSVRQREAEADHRRTKARAGRPIGQSASARSEHARDGIGLSLARHGERLAAALEVVVARRRGRVDASTRPRSGWLSPVRGSSAREVASGSVYSGCALRRRVFARSHESTGASVIPVSCCGFTTPKPLTRGVPARRRDRRDRPPRTRAVVRAARGRLGLDDRVVSSSTPMGRDRLPAARHHGVVTALQSATYRVRSRAFAGV
jgi:hypothetical protein